MLNFEDNIGLLVLQMIVSKKKQALFVKEFFKSDHFEQLWDKTFNFEDNLVLLVLKMIILKIQPLLVK